jgi:hypothetical protein
MDRNQYQDTPYPDDRAGNPPQDRLLGSQPDKAIPQSAPVQQSSSSYRAPLQDDVPFHQHTSNDPIANQYEETHPNDSVVKEGKRLSKKWQYRLYWCAQTHPITLVAGHEY